MKSIIAFLSIAMLAMLFLAATGGPAAAQSDSGILSGQKSSTAQAKEPEPEPFSFNAENIGDNLLTCANVGVVLLVIQFFFLFITSKLARVEFSSAANAVVAALLFGILFTGISFCRVQFWHMDFRDVIQTSLVAANVVLLFAIPYIFKAAFYEVMFFVIMLGAESVVGWIVFERLINGSKLWG